MKLYSRTRAAEVIDEYVPNEKYRCVLKLRLCEDMGYEAIGEAVGYSTQWVKDIVRRYRPEIMSLL
ncbi:MAG: hypothetical protein IKR93_05280 [Firmicutes bacterium]|nr:hypothetical protein [Bacillota bacterium]